MNEIKKYMAMDGSGYGYDNGNEWMAWWFKQSKVGLPVYTGILFFLLGPYYELCCVSSELYILMIN